MVTMRSAADDMWMMYPSADVMRMMYPACRQRADDICHPPAQISNEVSLSCHPHIVRTSSAHRTHETSVPRLFQVKQQRTALLKIKCLLKRCFIMFQFSPKVLDIALNAPTICQLCVTGYFLIRMRNTEN